MKSLKLKDGELEWRLLNINREYDIIIEIVPLYVYTIIWE